MIPHSEKAARPPKTGSVFAHDRWTPRPEAVKGRILVVEDEEIVRDALGPLLEEDGYQVTFAENGHEALRRLYTESLPDLIVLDLRMPVMDGWQFRTIQKDDPKLGRIPVVAISADGGPQAAAISAQAYLRKPVQSVEMLATIERIRFENERQLAARADETERLTALGRLAAGVGHEINNPLAFVMLNLSQALERLRPVLRAPGTPAAEAPRPEDELADIKARLAGVTDMLEDCQVGGERIRETVSHLQQLARRDDKQLGSVDMNEILEQAVAMAWNQIRHRARLVKSLGPVPRIAGNAAALGRVFLNLLVNAVQAIPEGDADRNEIRIVTKVERGENGASLVVEVRDSGRGMPPAIVARVFEPFFTTKPIGQGTGLGLSVSRRTVRDHGGRITLTSTVGQGTLFRVVLPAGDCPEAPAPATLADKIALARGRVLVIDDEPLIGRVIGNTLKAEHDVFVLQRASEAITRLERGETFDLVLCDVVMPDLSGPEFYATLAERWPQVAAQLVFMTGGAFTPDTVEFLERVPTRVLSKPFKIDQLRRLVRERLRGNA